MAWAGLNLTVDGRKALNNAQLSGKMCIKAIAVGDGTPPVNYQTQKSLVHQLYEITDIKIDRTETGCTLTVDFPTLDYDYYFREIGVIADTEEGEILYVYDNCGEDAQCIVSSAGSESTRKRIRLSLIISDVEQITVSNPSILYVSYDHFEQAAATLDSHMDDSGNPHNVTKEQIGLGEADNTSDMDKPVSTAQQAALDALETAVGLKANETELHSHTKDGVKHITAAERTKWNGKMETTGDSANNSITFSSGDTADPAAWTNVGMIASGEKHSSLWNKVSLFARNVRYLWKLMGNTSLSGIGDGTVTGAISSLNTGLFSRVRFYDIGKYDHTAMDLNAVAKDIYTRLLPYIGQTVIGKFVRGANYDFISSIGNEQYGFIVVISYNGEGMYLYKMVRGKMYCSTTTWVMMEV